MKHASLVALLASVIVSSCVPLAVREIIQNRDTLAGSAEAISATVAAGAKEIVQDSEFVARIAEEMAITMVAQTQGANPTSTETATTTIASSPIPTRTLAAPPTSTRLPKFSPVPTSTVPALPTYTPVPTSTATSFPTSTVPPLPTYTPIPETKNPTLSGPDNPDLCPAGCEVRPAGCYIKGNISVETGEKIYHPPNSKHYQYTAVRPEYGERWFCTETTAISNGWRKTTQYYECNPCAAGPVEFSGADLTDWNQPKGYFPYGNFVGANLNGANLREAVLGGANFDHADLRNADMTWVRFKLHRATCCAPGGRFEEHVNPHLWQAKYNAATQWPVGFEHPWALQFGAVFVDD